MLPLLILIASFAILIILRRIMKNISVNFAGRMAFGLMFVFTGTSHFYLTEGMIMTMPHFVPLPRLTVYLTGVIEIAFALMLIIGLYRRPVSALIICFLLAVLPSNIYAAIHQIDLRNATYNGPGLSYLFFRIPLQLLFIVWIYVFGIKGAGNKTKHLAEPVA